ncbi:hypothetical protein WN55_09195 [Dufourea novaeangliae]|uniref:Uncharacterized protein n=1 Tax=Dufourea novaeangliae TaxID=178035 RepID=A0A154P8X0_DUFNO|nr:hypothetical protein WN55_09195 [Dufourea novaeangliae]
MKQTVQKKISGKFQHEATNTVRKKNPQGTCYSAQRMIQQEKDRYPSAWRSRSRRQNRKSCA